MTFMSEKISDSDVELQKLRSSVVELSDLVKDMIKQTKFKEDDHLGFMECTVVCKQLEHLKSISLLVDANQNRDAWGISRIMLEGVALLIRVAAKPELASKWRVCFWVDQLKQLENAFKLPNYPEYKADIPRYKEELQLNLEKYGRPFLKLESKDKSQEEITPNDYLTDWKRGEDEKGKPQIRKIFSDGGLERYYEAFYSDASGWIHWDPINTQEAVLREHDGFTYENDSRPLGGAALAASSFALWGSAYLLNDHFKLGFSDRLMELHKGTIERAGIQA